MMNGAGGHDTRHDKEKSEAECVACRVDDMGNGSYQLFWQCQRAGSFLIDATIGGVHRASPPSALTPLPLALALTPRSRH
jgi:hypothetical protein